MHARMSRQRPIVNHESLAAIVRQIMLQPTSCRDLAAVSGLHVRTVLALFRVFRRRGIVFVHSWEKNARGAVAIPVFALGIGQPDARKPISAATIARKARAARQP